MELIDKARTSNDLFIRDKFPWTSRQQCYPWTEIVTDHLETNYVKNLLSIPIFLLKTPSLIRRVENPYLWARYMLSYEELNVHHPNAVMEHFFIHATSLANANNIADVNFDWRRVNRGRFGQGVSFATNASYAKKYASGKDVYIIAGVPIAKQTLGHYGTKIPPDCYDTTGDSRGYVKVKYYDNDFYPYYIVQ